MFDLRFGEIDYTITVGRYATGGVGEVFISCHKAGSMVSNLARDAAVMISLALQHGATIETMTSAVTRSEDGQPAGLAGAVLDEVNRRQEVAPAVPTRPPTLSVEPVTIPEPQPIGFLAPAIPRLSGEICATCHAAAMVRTGTCLTCQVCGNSSGGCS